MIRYVGTIEDIRAGQIEGQAHRWDHASSIDLAHWQIHVHDPHVWLKGETNCAIVNGRWGIARKGAALPTL
jgi:hypothetical protein